MEAKAIVLLILTPIVIGWIIYEWIWIYKYKKQQGKDNISK